MKIYAFLLLIGFSFSACTPSNENKENLPVARGSAGEIIVVIDSVKWEGAVGQTLRDIFMAPASGLPQDEPLYRLHQVNPFLLNDILKSAKNMIFVATMQGNTQGNQKLIGYFTKASREKIMNNPELFYYRKQNEFAKGQEVLYLFGKNSNELVANLNANGERVRGYFDEVEKARLKKSLYAQKEEGVQNILKAQHDFFIQVPYGYEIAKNKDHFVWLRQLGRETDKNVFITYRDYNAEGLFSKDNILNLREAVAREHIYDADDTTLYITTQRVAPVDTAVVNFNGHYAVKMKGLWKLTDNSLGGPFVSYTLVDEDLGRLYYIEGFVSSPGNDKRDLMREMEVILSTFRTDSKKGS